jgi:sugar-specific transcriptional regulator TrmB
MELIPNLTKLGLSENQAKVYLATLQLGTDTVQNIARYAMLKRPTVYLLLDDLVNLGLMSKTQKNRKTVFLPADPQHLLDKVQTQEKIIGGLLPHLQALYNVNPEKPSIKIAERVDGVRNVYNAIFNYFLQHKNEELLIFGALKDASAHFKEEVVDYFYTIMAQSLNPIREIGNDDVETRRYYRRSFRLNPRHTIRLIRGDGQFIQTDNMLYGNTLVIFSVREQIFAITIESPTIAETYRTMFNMAWRSGKKL